MKVSKNQLNKNLCSQHKIAVIGASGLVGQSTISLLKGHPWFEVGYVSASEKRLNTSAGDLFPHLRHLNFEDYRKIPEGTFVISALKNSVAKEVERSLTQRGCVLISNASIHRFQEYTQLLLPDVNGEALEKEINHLCVPNCIASALTLALKPLYIHFGIESVQVTTMQAISGAGYGGLNAFDTMGNILPFIQGEEEKIEKELLELLKGEFPISATAVRVPIVDGHTQSVSVKFKKKAEREEIIEVWNEYRSLAQQLHLPSAASQPILYKEDALFPQPRVHIHDDKGMRVSIGRLRKCLNFDYKFVMVSHNRIQGAAGAALLAAELIFLQRMQHDKTSFKTAHALART